MAQTATPPRLAYKLREVADLTPFGYDRLLAFVKAGELKAKRNQDQHGEPVGPYVVLAKDLEEFLDGMPDA